MQSDVGQRDSIDGEFLATRTDVRPWSLPDGSPGGKGGWILDTTGGDDYTRILEAWGKRELTKDSEKDLYREVIDLWDGTRIESTARLSDHHD